MADDLSFRSRRLRELFVKGKSRRIPSDHVAKCLRILDALAVAENPEQMNIPGWKFHPLQGRPRRYSVWVSGNYRITWEWSDGRPCNIDYEDYR